MTATVFARHETFHPRYGWLKKGVDAAMADPEVFLRPDAHVTLGVGKNMVRSIRYWCHAFKLLVGDDTAGGSKGASKSSSLGEGLLGDGGLDPYFEDLGSLWLLHWHLLKEPCIATAWWYAFFVHTRPEISIDSLAAGLTEYVGQHFPSARAARSSLRKDASCLIRMYGEVPNGSLVNEESIHCPFAELSLIRPGADPKSYVFRIGPKPGLSSNLIAAMCLEYAASRGGAGAQTISLARLLHEPGSPGLAFKLSESALYAALEEVADVEPDVSFSDTGGIIQLSYAAPPLAIRRKLIMEHYKHARGEVLA